MDNTLLTVKFNIDDVIFLVIIDKTFYSDIEQTNAPLKNLHFHVDYKLFFLQDGVLDVTLENNEKISFKNSFVIILPFLKHYTTRHVGNSFRILFSFKCKSTKSSL